MLYNVLKRMIERGMTDGLAEKIAVFWATGQLTDQQYYELMELLNAATGGNG